jgi:predicted helicase
MHQKTELLHQLQNGSVLSKQFLGDAGTEPMRRAVAFCQSIPASRKIAESWNTAADAYLGSLPADAKERMACPSARHIDGTMTAPQRDELLGAGSRRSRKAVNAASSAMSGC